MEIYIRHIDQATPVPFDTVPFSEIDDLIAFVRRSGGVYWDGDLRPFFAYQLVLDDDAGYCEIIIGEE